MSAQQWGQPPGRSSFDAAQRDRQARGKDPYARSEDEESEDSDESGAGEKKKQQQQQPRRGGQGVAVDTFMDRETRAYAMSVLDDPEQLMMWAQSQNDSIASQRRRFTAMLCGHKNDLKPIPPKPAKKNKTSSQDKAARSRGQRPSGAGEGSSSAAAAAEEEETEPRPPFTGL